MSLKRRKTSNEIPRLSSSNEGIDDMAGHQTKRRTFNSLQLTSR